MFTNIFKLITNVFKPKPRTLLTDFKETRTFIQDRRGPNYVTHLEYFNDKNESIGYIDYRLSNGEIDMFGLEHKYRNQGLGKQILLKTIDEMKQQHLKEIWGFALEGHPFWSNVFNKSFTYRNPIHPSSPTLCGYFMKL